MTFTNRYTKRGQNEEGSGEQLFVAKDTNMITTKSLAEACVLIVGSGTLVDEILTGLKSHGELCSKGINTETYSTFLDRCWQCRNHGRFGISRQWTRPRRERSQYGRCQ